MNRHLIHFEFAGIQGAGKTTLAKKVLSRLEPRGIRFPSLEHISRVQSSGPTSPHPEWRVFKHTLRVPRKIDYSLVLARNPLTALMALRLALTTRPLNPTSLQVTHRLLRWCRVYARQKWPPGLDGVLFDDAILQASGSILLGGDAYAANRAESILGHFIHQFDLRCIFVHIHPELAAQRMRDRARHLSEGRFRIWRYGNDSPSLQKAKARQATEIYSRMSDMTHRLRPHRTLRVDAGGDMAENSERIVLFIEQNLELERDR